MNNLNQYYEILDLEPGATPNDIKQAYRDLAKVWHPDRFLHDPRLLQKAQQKLKEINDAYEQLRGSRLNRPAKSSQAKPKEPKTKSDSTKKHQQASEPLTDLSRDERLIKAIADQLRSGEPSGSLRFVLMLENIGLRCCETNRARAICGELTIGVLEEGSGKLTVLR